MLTTADLVRLVITVAFAVILCGLKLKLVLYVDAILSVISAIYNYFFAKIELHEYSHGVSVDVLHELLAQLRVALLLMPALMWLISHRSTDITVRTAFAVSRFLSSMVAFIVTAIAHWTHDSFTTPHLLYSVLPYGLWTLVMLIQLIRTGSRVNIKMRRTDVNTYMSVDMFTLLLLSLTHLFIPGILYPLIGVYSDALHIYHHRVNGAIMLGLAAHTWVGQRYRNGEDKHCLLFARVICILPWIVTVAIAVMRNFLPKHEIVVLLPGVAMLIPAMLGCAFTENGPMTLNFWKGDTERRMSTPLEGGLHQFGQVSESQPPQS